MKTFLYTFLFTLALVGSINAQSPFRIQKKCPAPNASTYGSISIESLGDIRHKPCPARTTFFTGLVDFSGATVTGLVVAGGTFLGDNKTAAAPSFSFVNSPSTGFFRSAADTIGVSTAGVERWKFVGTGLLSTGNAVIAAPLGSLSLSASTSATLSGGTTANVGAGSMVLTLNSAAENITLNAGTVGGTATLEANNGAGGSVSTMGIGSVSVNAPTQLDLIGGTWNASSTGNMGLRAGTTAGVSFLAATGVTTLGDLTFVGSNILLDDNGAASVFGATETVLGSSSQGIRVVQGIDTLRSTAATWDMGTAGGAGYGVTNYLYNRTITAAGVTGAQVINLPAGTVNFAAGATALTVTNSTVNTSSIILSMARTNDATCSVKNVVAGAGSFVINMTAACTAETSVGFLVHN